MLKLAKSFALSLPKSCTLVSPLLNGADFTVSVAKTLPLRNSSHSSYNSHSSRSFYVPLSNGMTGDRSTETNDRMGAVRIRHSIRGICHPASQSLDTAGWQEKWLPLNFGFNDVMRTAPISGYTVLLLIEKMNQINTKN